MIGILRVVDGSGEREWELPRGAVTLGGGDSDTVRVAGFRAAVLSAAWEPRRATWMLQGSELVILNGREIVPGEPVPLAHLDHIELSGAMAQFERRLGPPRHAGGETAHIALGEEPLVFGRGQREGAGRVELDADESSISGEHARIEKADGAWWLSDTSRHGMELNGLAFTRERLVFGDRFRIAGYIFEFVGDAIAWIQPEVAGSISARDVVFTAGGRRILEGVSLNIAAGEFVGVLGGSGQGKSTLLNALCGINPPTAGTVEIGGVPLTERGRLREIGIGYVPQDDIVHRELTVTDAVTFSARLRLRLPRPQIDALVGRVIARLGLEEHAWKRVADLSGGQRKRVSIAIELLTKPSVLFLDEPSSGLDPATEESLMTLLQSLTLTKLTVVCTTHVLQKAYLFDRILFIQGGRLVFAGQADQARRHFLLHDPADEHSALAHSPLERVYVLLAGGERTAEEWERFYAASLFAREAVPALPCGAAAGGVQRVPRVPAWRTLWLLAARQWRILRADPLNLAFLLAQPLLIGLMIGWVSDDAALRLFLCIVATMWFGCSNGAQQIVGELPIFRRERVCGQGLNAYVLSKLGFLSSVSLAQAALLLCTAIAVAHWFHPEELDRENLRADLTKRLSPAAAVAAPTTDDGGVFDVVGAEKPPAAPTPSREPAPKPREVSPWKVDAILAVARFFQVTSNVLDSGPRPLARVDGTPLRDTGGAQLSIPGTPVLEVLAVTLGLRLLAVAAASVVGVGIGLAISSLVKNVTQAVLWVPLVLIPQILFGGIVVLVPDMSASVRAFSHVVPSFAAQRIMDVSAIYGLATPFVSNRTKTALFLSSRGEKETVKWTEDGRDFSQDYDKVSPVNPSWQNLAVIPEGLGQHKHAGERVGFRMEYRDTVEQRADVRFSQGTIFRSLREVWLSLAVLAAWVAACYAVTLAGLARQQTGK